MHLNPPQTAETGQSFDKLFAPGLITLNGYALIETAHPVEIRFFHKPGKQQRKYTIMSKDSVVAFRRP